MSIIEIEVYGRLKCKTVVVKRKLVDKDNKLFVKYKRDLVSVTPCNYTGYDETYYRGKVFELQ